MRTSRIPTTAAVAAAATVALALTVTVVGGALAATGDGGADGSAPRSTATFRTVAKVNPSAPYTKRPKVNPSEPYTVAPDPDPDPSAPIRLKKSVAVKAAAAKPAAEVRQCDGTEMSYSVLHRFPGSGASTCSSPRRTPTPSRAGSRRTRPSCSATA
ncbi:hypothetical protein ACFQ2B_36410 [Streptomyces stramineus]